MFESVPDLVLVTPPEAAPIDLASAKAHLRVDFESDDALIQGLIDAATAWLDGHAGVLGRALVTQTWKARFDYCFPAWRIPLPLSPVQAVDSIEYVDAQGATQTVSSSDYVVIDGPAAAVQPAFGKAWPAPRGQARAVAITFTAGYGAPDDVPGALKAAIKLLVGHFYEHREGVVGVEQRDSSAELPLGVAALIRPFRARSVA